VSKQAKVAVFSAFLALGGIISPSLQAAEGENRVIFEAQLDFFGQTPWFYTSSHGVVYQPLGWSHEERLTIVPSILPFGMEMAIAGRFKTLPREPYADSFQVVASDATLWGPWVSVDVWARPLKVRLGLEGRSQSYSAHQVPAQVWFLESEYGGIKVDAQWYQQAYTDSQRLYEGDQMWAPQKYVKIGAEFLHGPYVVTAGLRHWYTDDPTHPEMHGLSLRQFWLAAGSRLVIEGQELRLLASVERWNEFLLSRITLSTTFAKIGF